MPNNRLILRLKFFLLSSSFLLLAIPTPNLFGQTAVPTSNELKNAAGSATQVKFNRINNGDPSESSTNRTLDRLNQLQQKIQMIQDGTENQLELVRPMATLKNESQDSLPLQKLENETRIQAINQRISIIKEMLERQNAATEAARIAAEQRSVEMPEPTPIEPTPIEPTQASPAVQAITQEPELAEADPHANTQIQSESETPISDGIKVLSSPVNSFELANSLFATGNYSQALKSYEELLDEETVEIDRDWLRCLAANCYRIAGDLPAAEKLYRDVAASKEQAYPSDQSKWYLDHLTRRKRIASDLQMIDAELQSMTANGNQK